MKMVKIGLEEWIEQYRNILEILHRDMAPNVDFKVFCFGFYQAPITYVGE